MARISTLATDKKYFYIKVICETKIEYKKYLTKIKKMVEKIE
jgi:hypothetical protein